MNITLCTTLAHKIQELTCLSTSQNNDNFTATRRTQTSPFSHNFEKHNHYSHNFGHAYLNINITKTHFIPTLSSKHTQPKVQWELVIVTCKGGTILVFGMNIFNLKGSFGKGAKGKEPHTLINVQTMNLCPKPSPKLVQATSTSTPLNEHLLFTLTFFVTLFFLKFYVSSSSVKNP